MSARRIGVGLIFMLSAAIGLAAADVTEVGKSDPRYLRAQLALFQSYPVERQQQIRDLDEEFHKLSEADQKRLRKVMERYAAWMERQSEKTIHKIEGYSKSESKLAAIEEIKVLEWVETLPKARREEYASAKLADKPGLIEKWKLEEAVRQEQWEFVQAHWTELNETPPAKMQKMVQINQAEFELYLKNLFSQLSNQEKAHHLKDLIAEAKEAKEGDASKKLALLIYTKDLSSRPLLPGPQTGPKTFGELPDKVQNYLDRYEKKGYKLRLGKNSQGRWPDYALAVASHAANMNYTLPLPIVAAVRKSQMPDEVKKFIEEELEGKLFKTEAGKKDMDRLKAAEGKWPDYPKTIMDIAREKNLHVPGWMPPVLKKE